MTEYLKMLPLPSWKQNFDLKVLSVSKSFEGLLSWNSESKLITPKYITGTYFGAIVAIFNFCFSVCFLCVMFFLTPEQAPKAGPCHLYMICFNTTLIHLTRLLLQNCCTTFTLSIKYEIIEGFWSARCLNDCINLPNMIGLFASSGTASLVANI